jgi:Holliday junction DNA helicase RuvA
MIARIMGILEQVEAGSVLIRPGPDEAGLSYEVLVPMFLVEHLSGHLGRRVTLHTIEYLESQGQGTSFVPRLIGFTEAQDLRFFGLFTTVKGLGVRKALKALVIEPAAVARAIATRDTKTLLTLPGVGKRLAETMVAELHGKAEKFLTAEAIAEVESKLSASALTPPVAEAIETLIALGQTRSEAERLVGRAIDAGAGVDTPDELVTAALGGWGGHRG